MSETLDMHSRELRGEPHGAHEELPRAEELERQVELRSMELESLKAQARIKERELLERRVEHLQRRVETLEVG